MKKSTDGLGVEPCRWYGRMVSTPTEDGDVLICGLGRLGVECARVLQRYAVSVRGLTLSEPDEPLEIPIVRGDCRYRDVLLAAGAVQCRAVLLVTGDTRVNMEAALAVRKLNSEIRIVARSTGHHANSVFSELLGNFVSHEPKQLAAGALALAALRAETIGYFSLEGRMVRVLRHQLVAGDHWIGARIADVSTHNYVVLAHQTRPAAEGSPHERGASAKGLPMARYLEQARTSSRDLFHAFDPEAVLADGDVVTVLVLEGTALEEQPAPAGAPGPKRRPALRLLIARLFTAHKTAKVTVGAAAIVLLALVISMWLFPSADPSISWLDGIFTALVLMTGGTYADLFPAFHHLSNSVRLFSILLSVMGTAAVGLVYAWLTDTIMTLRLRLAPRPPAPPLGDHVIIVGLGSIGRSAAALLRALSRPAVAVECDPSDDPFVRQLCVLSGNGADASTLEAGGIVGARGFLAATGDDWQNLEMALLARTLNPDCALAICTNERHFSVNVAGIVPQLEVVCVPVVAAKAFAAAALGQTVLDLFQLAGRTVYVVEHRVARNDGLDGRLLSEIAEGYSVVPVLYEAPLGPPHPWSMVDPPVVVQTGYRVVLLGPSSSLRRITRAEMHAPSIAFELRELRPHADRVLAASVLARHVGCSLDEAQGLLGSLPVSLARRLYRQQGHRLRTALERTGTVVALDD